MHPPGDHRDRQHGPAGRPAAGSGSATVAWTALAVGAAAAFLVSAANSYLTGQTVVVDGGFTCL
jgi:NAD(P)-dependent dehydrogenase (short-subunit alcohol dehydrogenase family)